MATEVLTNYPDRLAAAARDVADTAAAARLAITLRDGLIRQAVDSGELSQRAVAAAAGVTVGNVGRILAKPHDQ